MKQTNPRLAVQQATDRADFNAGARIYRGGWPIEQCETDMQRAGFMDALQAEADAETERYLAAHPQAVAA
jgi:hypothetical protein